MISIDSDGVEVIFLDSDHDGAIYSIRKQELGYTRDTDYSKWIMDLLNKTWMTKELLYKLATIINKELPKNSINWEKTFFVVEKKEYLDQARDKLLPKDVSLTENLLNKFKLNSELSTPKKHETIEAIVNERLIYYGIKKV